MAALRQLLAVAENYPQLKANENFLALQSELSNTEDRLQTARRYYNGNVREYNRRVQSFPSMIVANFGHFELEEFFEVDESLRGDAGVPKVDFSSLSNAGASGAPEPRGSGGAPGAAGGRRAPPPPATGLATRRRAAGAPRCRGASGCRSAAKSGSRRTVAGQQPPDAGPRPARSRRRSSRRRVAPIWSASVEAIRLETPSDSVINAKSKAKIRPRIWSGTSRCSP